MSYRNITWKNVIPKHHLKKCHTETSPEKMSYGNITWKNVIPKHHLKKCHTEKISFNALENALEGFYWLFYVFTYRDVINIGDGQQTLDSDFEQGDLYRAILGVTQQQFGFLRSHPKDRTIHSPPMTSYD
jgi:hypothetical protein